MEGRAQRGSLRRTPSGHDRLEDDSSALLPDGYLDLASVCVCVCTLVPWRTHALTHTVNSFYSLIPACMPYGSRRRLTALVPGAKHTHTQDKHTGQSDGSQSLRHAEPQSTGQKPNKHLELISEQKNHSWPLEARSGITC